MAENGDWLEKFGEIVWKKVIYSLVIAMLITVVAIIGGWEMGSPILGKLLFLFLLAVVFYFTIEKYVDVMIAFALILFSYLLFSALMYVANVGAYGGSLGIGTNLMLIALAIILAKDGLDKSDIFPYFMGMALLLMFEFVGLLTALDSAIASVI